MKKSWLASGLSLGLALCAMYWFYVSDTDIQPTVVKTAPHQLSQDVPTTYSSTTAMPDKTPVPASEDLDSLVEDALVKFTEYSQYPPTSQPIHNTEHINAFINSSLPQSSLPFPFPDLETPMQASIVLNQHNYFYGDSVIAEVNVSGAPESSSISTRAVLMTIDGDIIAESTHQENKDNTEIITFDTHAHLASDWPIEMNVGAYIDVDGRNIFISAPFKINDQTAALESIGFSEPVSENLTIPLNLNVSLAGYYYVAAILYSRTTQSPLIHLETEGQLTEGLSTLTLKAHIKALKKGGDEGPYYLDNIRIERWSDEIIPRDIAGKVTDNDFLVEGYSFNDYEDKPYLDPLAEERQRLIQGLSSR